MEEFITILNDETAEIVEKKSKFIANLIHVETTEEAESKIKEIKKKYHDARHNCVAYRVAENGKIVEKSSDDGEPSGTAGGPMLNILQKNNLCNLVVIVTRYFGGILLGTGEIQINLDYANLEFFKYYCKNNDINIKKIDYSENVILKIEMEENRKTIFLNDIETKKLNVQHFQLIEEKYINKTVEKNK